MLAHAATLMVPTAALDEIHPSRHGALATNKRERAVVHRHRRGGRDSEDDTLRIRACHIDEGIVLDGKLHADPTRQKNRRSTGRMINLIATARPAYSPDAVGRWPAVKQVGFQNAVRQLQEITPESNTQNQSSTFRTAQ